jgi:hypothetical protein
MSTQIISQEKQAVREVAVIAATPNILPTVLERTACKVFESFSDRLKASSNGRQERALKLALNGHVTHKSKRIFSVRSQRGQHSYLVNLDKSFCTCPDSCKGHVCKHRIAAYLIEQASEATHEVSQESSAVRELQSSQGLDPDEEAVEKARLALQGRSEHLREAVIYALLQVDGEPVKVEIIALEGEVALVRALPKLKDGVLIPQFPFPERKSSAQVLAKSLTEVRIYR